MKVNIKTQRLLLILTVMTALIFSVSTSHSADILILGDTELQPVSNVTKAISRVSADAFSVKAVKDVNNDLLNVVRRENAKVVVALGRDALTVSQALPESISVIYGLVIRPPDTARKNITGVYMATPVKEYMSLLGKYFSNIKKLGIICEPESVRHFEFCVTPSNAEVHTAANSYEFVQKIKELQGKVDAILLLPEKNILSAAAIKETYLFSFTEKIPVLGISEKHVKTGSLLSLVFDEEAMGQQIGKLALKALSQGSAEGLPQSPPEKFNLFINEATANEMNIAVPEPLLKTAGKVY